MNFIELAVGEPKSPSEAVRDLALNPRAATRTKGGPWPACIAITVTPKRHAGIGRGTLPTLRSMPLDASDAQLAAFRGAMSSMEVG